MHTGECFRESMLSSHATGLLCFHNFCAVTNKWKVCSDYFSFKLGGDNPHAIEQLLACYLFANISTCLHGNQVGVMDTFFCPPPSSETYLQL